MPQKEKLERKAHPGAIKFHFNKHYYEKLGSMFNKQHYQRMKADLCEHPTVVMPRS